MRACANIDRQSTQAPRAKVIECWLIDFQIRLRFDNVDFDVLRACARAALISSANFDSTRINTHTHTGQRQLCCDISCAFYERFPVRASLLASLQLQIVRYTLLLPLLLLLLLSVYVCVFAHVYALHRTAPATFARCQTLRLRLKTRRGPFSRAMAPSSHTHTYIA